jgi:DNA ligase-1
VEYHVYDLPSAWGFKQRWDFLSLHLTQLDGKHFEPSVPHPLKLVQTALAQDEDELMVAFNTYLKLGYEGAMARNANGQYVHKRSTDLLKIKEFIDSEFQVVGVEEGRGKLAGHAIFVCRTTAGVDFRAKLMGDTSELKKYFENPALAIGRFLTVKYQGLTNKNGVPRFPVAVRFREDV